jgi:Mu transposase, C-terminal domain
VVGCLPYSRAGAGTLVFSKEAADLLHGIGDCLAKLGALPTTLVWDREGALHAGDGRPTEPFAAFCGQLGVGWRILEARDPQSKGVVERLQGYLETSFEPGRRFANELDFHEQLERWFVERANLRFHRTLRCRPLDRLAEELALMRSLPPRLPDVDRRLVTRVPPDPYLRVDTNDYSLDPSLVGKSVSRSARCWRSRSRRASSLAGIGARSPATARSPCSSTPARSGSYVAARSSPRSRRGRLSATTS